MFPKVPQSSQTESLGFPSYPPLEHPGTLRNPTINQSINQSNTVPNGQRGKVMPGGFLQCIGVGLLLLGDIPGEILCGKTHPFLVELKVG